MDDTLYNTWMPNVSDFRSALWAEIQQYFHLGRFYPVKYIANLLKWRYLPNDPFIFRYFNFGVFILTISFGALAALTVSRAQFAKFNRLALGGLFIFFVGSALLHKPLLETISLNPLGETWVCFFFTLGSFFLFQKNRISSLFLSRLCFLLVALSKEPAALAFFALFVYSATRSWLEPQARKKWALNAAIDLLLFLALLTLALSVMAQGTFTKNAYFSTTPWLTYAQDLLYKLARYALWTSPFLALFMACRRELWQMLRDKHSQLLPAALFFGSFAFSYDVFMSSQGIVAYQQVPAAIGYFCLFSVITAALAASGALGEKIAKYGLPLLLLFSFSYLVSIGRWQRFVRGFVEPRKAVMNLIHSGQQITIFVPRGEILGHITELLKEHNPTSKVFQVGDKYGEQELPIVGRVFVFEFPIYMGNLPPKLLAEVEEIAGGWASVSDARTYKIYRGNKLFADSQKQ